MIKRIFAATIGAALMLQALPALAARTFTDLDEKHWAYSVVNTLVDEGTINGYEDGSFKPTNTVTRAEFVKMIGIASETKVEFSDVTPDHWAYDYISYTEMEASYDDVFEPGRAITRRETLPVLWIRAGKPAVSDIPANITAQANGKNEDAVKWGYAYGVMVGDDGVNLRLDDTLTRAEAAALIIKARNSKEQVNFGQSEKTDIDIYEYVYNSMAMFDTPYEANGTITNGEMARASVRLASDEHTPTYGSYYVAETNFKHKYANDLSAVAPICPIGKENVTAEFIDKEATIEDVEHMLRSAFSIRQRKSFLEEFDGASDKSAKATKKQIAQMLIQFGRSCGMLTSVTTEQDEYLDYITNIEIANTDMNTYPKNYMDYSGIIANVPNAVYETARIGNNKPVDSFTFAVDFSALFANKCKQLEEIAKSQYGADVDILFYPSLAYDTGSGYAIRIKCTVNSVSKAVSATDLFKTVLAGNSGSLKAGDVFFAEVDFGTYAIFE